MQRRTRSELQAAAVTASPKKKAAIGTKVKNARKPMEVTITKVGTSAGIILPKAALQKLHARKGQKLFVTEAPGGGLRISRYNGEFERQMRHAYEAIDLFPEALKELAE
jgi:antitoxin component of MazEF toxin-antitoxin module